jgi:hypothetical protein
MGGSCNSNGTSKGREEELNLFLEVIGHAGTLHC